MIRFAVVAALLVFSGCAITLPPVSTAPNDPSNPNAAESRSAPLRPGLVAGAKTYLSPKAGADAQQMNHGGMQGMEGMNHGGDSMKRMPGMAGSPRNPAEKATAEIEQNKPGATPSGEQLQSTHASEYTCRMHPDVHSEKPGKCPRCGMTLVTRESLQKNQPQESPTP